MALWVPVYPTLAPSPLGTHSKARTSTRVSPLATASPVEGKEIRESPEPLPLKIQQLSLSVVTYGVGC